MVVKNNSKLKASENVFTSMLQKNKSFGIFGCELFLKQKMCPGAIFIDLVRALFIDL